MAKFRSSKITNQLKGNLLMFIEEMLLEEGYYRNIKRGETDFLGRDLSRALPYDDTSTWGSGLVWQAPFNNLVYEEGLSLPAGAEAPINVSGVYINSSFYPKDDPDYGHHLNYIDGQIIFSSGVAPLESDIVQLEYSSKDYYAALPDKDTIFALSNDYFINDGIFDAVFPSGLTKSPSVWVEVAGHDLSPLAIGGGKIIHKTVHVHVVGNDNHLDLIDDIADAITYKQHTAINLIDIDSMPEILNSVGDRAAGFRSYTSLYNDQSLRLSRAYIVDAHKVSASTQRKDWNRVRVDLLLEIRGIPGQ